jgi:hypothetical protein
MLAAAPLDICFPDGGLLAKVTGETKANYGEKPGSFV